jgi:hypothetical protein
MAENRISAAAIRAAIPAIPAISGRPGAGDMGGVLREGVGCACRATKALQIEAEAEAGKVEEVRR